VERLGVPARRIEVIHQGVPETYFHFEDQKTVREIREKFNIQGRYFLYVGGFDRRKNLPGLLEIFRILRKTIADIQLVLVGDVEKESPVDLVLKKGLQGAVVLTGYVSEENLIRLYRHAEALLFLSFSEGFGLPALEAMASRTPVIFSRGTAIQEVVGNQGIGVDPRKPTEVIQEMTRLLADSSYREEIARRGRERAEKFTWQDTARKTMALYRSLIKEGKGGNSP